eukprot:TRINITY_DN5617_c0_g1_i1.p1 TRINITY_DN5617_c0_g1~~TRINITY_DN5617_c0_g1_i1.p1  ORF type:complete len:228 (+),score=28.97 TRINITY_DN5617_c0_g1_i1:112-795(+)
MSCHTSSSGSFALVSRCERHAMDSPAQTSPLALQKQRRARRKLGFDAVLLISAGCSLLLAILGLTGAPAWLTGRVARTLSCHGSLGLHSIERPGPLRIARPAEESESEEPEPITEIRPGDRFVGWLKHPVLTRTVKENLFLEVSQNKRGEKVGTWRVERTKARRGAAPMYEAPFEIIEHSDGIIQMRDADVTVLNATLNGAGPGTITGRVAQQGLIWGGFFEAKLEK